MHISNQGVSFLQLIFSNRFAKFWLCVTGYIYINCKHISTTDFLHKAWLVWKISRGHDWRGRTALIFTNQSHFTYKNFQNFMQPSMANLNSPSSRVVKDSTPFRRRILRCKNFGKGESWPSLFLDVVNLYLMKFRHRWILNERTFYYFIILFIWKWILT